MDEFFDRSIVSLHLGTRAQKSLEHANILTIFELMQHSEPELLHMTKRLGPVCLGRIKQALAQYGLRLGMWDKLDEWTPEAIPALIKKQEEDFMKHWIPAVQAWGWTSPHENRQELTEAEQIAAMQHILDCGHSECRQARKSIFSCLKNVFSITEDIRNKFMHEDGYYRPTEKTDIGLLE